MNGLRIWSAEELGAGSAHEPGPDEAPEVFLEAASVSAPTEKSYMDYVNALMGFVAERSLGCEF